MKVFVHLSEYGHIKVISLTAREILWKLIYQDGDDFQYSDWRANETLPHYTLEEFLALTDDELHDAVEDYTEGRGWPAIVEVEE
jgi:hypothetical protein